MLRVGVLTALIFLAVPVFASAHDLANSCRYVLTDNKHVNPQEIVQVPPDSWREIRSSVIALGSSNQILWLDCSINLEPRGAQLAIVSQYNFSRNIQAFAVPDSKGLMPLEAYEKSLWQRQDAFKLPISRVTRVIIRYEADLVKTAYFQIMSEGELRQQGQREVAFFFIDAGIVGIFVAFNLLLALSFRSVIPIFYALTTSSYFFYQIIQFGFGPVLFYPGSPEFNGKMISISAGIAIIFYQTFFQKLLQLPEIAPIVNRAMVLINILATLYIIATIIGLAPIGLLQKLGRVLFFVASVFVFLGGWIVYRKRFRPALYSIYGFVIMTICQTLYFLVMAGFIDAGAYYVKALLPLGQLVEYMLFFTTLSLRLRDKGQISRLRDIAQEETAHRMIARNSKLRLSESRIKAVEQALRSLIESEKIFCEEDLSLDRLADRLGLTRHELSDYLSRKLSTNFYDFVNKYRIEEAQRLLREDSQRRVLEIALAVGFNTKSTFNKEFKRLTGRTPTEFRAKQ